MNSKDFKILFLQHSRWVKPGEYGLWAERNGYSFSIIKLFEYEEIPTSVDADMLIILGGPQNPASTKEEYGFFDVEKEKNIINLYASRGRIVLGTCLGAQIIGEAMGATYHHSPYQEVGHVRGNLTEEGRRDPFLADFPDSFDMGEWHNDMPGLTHKSEVLAYSDGCPHQIVRYGKYLYGFQTHMELNHELVEGLVESSVDDPTVYTGPYICSNEDILSYDFSEMNRLLSSFLDKIAEDYLKNKK